MPTLGALETEAGSVFGAGVVAHWRWRRGLGCKRGGTDCTRRWGLCEAVGGLPGNLKECQCRYLTGRDGRHRRPGQAPSAGSLGSPPEGGGRLPVFPEGRSTVLMSEICTCGFHGGVNTLTPE